MLRLATVHTGDSTRVVRVDGPTGDAPVAELPFPDLRSLFAVRNWRELVHREDRPSGRLADYRLSAPISASSLMLCVGQNYRQHVIEMGRQIPADPTIFAKVGPTLIGPHDDIHVPVATGKLDWEAELAVVVGAPLYRASVDEARKAIAGYTLMNDITARDWQFRTSQWFIGKNAASSSPVGPVVVTPDELPHNANGDPDVEIGCDVDGVSRQRARTGDLIFPPGAILAHLSQVMRLSPGDLVATGTAGGVGHAMDPPTFLRVGQTVRTWGTGMGECLNTCVAATTLGVPAPQLAGRPERSV